MKLLRCHIENFGRLSRLDHNFSDGIDTIYEDNGWGKTTFATFIRVMFFGFNNDGSRKELDNERRHYAPWQGGVYGGSISFEADGKAYRIERTFGEKKSGTDTYALYDLATNLECSDYPENIGEKLFGIDAGSFANTVFISQYTCETSPTAGISAKIGNAAGIEGDMAGYEKVRSSLQDELNVLYPKKGMGGERSIKAAEGRIAELTAAIRSKSDTEQSVEKIDAEIKLLSDKLEKKETKRNQISDKIAALSRQNANKADAKEYNLLKTAFKGSVKKYEEEKSYFPGDIPDKKHVGEMSEICNAAIAAGRNRDDNALSGDDASFFEKCSGLFSENRPDRARINDLINRCSERKSKKSSLETRRANAAMLKAARLSGNNGNNGLKIMVAAGIVMFFSGIIMMILSNVAVGALLAVCGVAMSFAGLFADRKTGKSRAEAETIVSPEYQALMDEIKADEDYIALTGKEITDYLALFYDDDVPEEEYVGRLSKLNEMDMRYDGLKAQYDRYDKAGREASEYGKQVEEYLIGLGFFVDADEDAASYNNRLSEINNHIFRCEQAFCEKNDCENRLRQFEATHDMDKIAKVNDDKAGGMDMAWIDKNEADDNRYDSGSCDGGDDGTSDLQTDLSEKLNEDFRMINSEIEDVRFNIDSYKKQRDKLAEQLEEMDDNENEIDSLTEKKKALKHRYDVLEKTRDFLERAKTGFTSKYMEPVNASFSGYYSQISREDGKDYELDANLDLKLRETGTTHNLKYLSEGYSDVVGLCRRMSFIDAMYKEEKPFIIMDDPFESMDDEHVKGALDLLKYISESYQIVYFTCHSSRKPI